MSLLETFVELDALYECVEKTSEELNESLTEGRTMPYALLVCLDGKWKVFKGLEAEPTTEKELAELDSFLEDRPEYSEVKVVPSSDIYKYVNKETKALDENLSREELIARLTALGKHYHFNKYSDEQLYRILEKAEAEKEEQEAFRDFYASKTEKPTCDECGCELTDGGYCPICDDGEEYLDEDIFDGTFNNRSNWIPIPSTNTPPQQTASSTGTPSSNTNNSSSTGKYIVTIMYDGHKLRARADDGIHGRANVAFPTALRNHNGQQYEVEGLTWNGKNYRAVGKIRPINSVSNTQNINENINKENLEMNFIETFAELNKLYEEVPAEPLEEASAGIHLDGKNLDTIEDIACELDKQDCDMSYVKKWTKEVNADIKVEDLAIAAEQSDFAKQIKSLGAYMKANNYKTFGDFAKALTEALKEDTDEEHIEDEVKRVVIECSKCGALVVKDEADIKVDEASGLVNVDDTCQFCEETEGYVIVGYLVPYEGAEVAEEAVEDEVVEDEAQ